MNLFKYKIIFKASICEDIDAFKNHTKDERNTCN